MYPVCPLENITQIGEMALSVRRQAFGYAMRYSLPGYRRQCKHLKLCWGECPKSDLIASPDGEACLDYICSGTRRFHDHVSAALYQIATRFS
ncbi:hypothetical protein [Paraburkholderia acidiphila]|uniref:hypothetical protein n=1 Tax=Paraburkholderia acidiphila TaxID=2571747 RepID=UPI002D7E5AF4|nr:hypothetical protein [Paraburkholderia acidiphila]